MWRKQEWAQERHWHLQFREFYCGRFITGRKLEIKLTRTMYNQPRSGNWLVQGQLTNGRKNTQRHRMST
jgi:hypothetical protein